MATSVTSRNGFLDGCVVNGQSVNPSNIHGNTLHVANLRDIHT